MTVIGGRGGIMQRLSRAWGAGVHPVAGRRQHCTCAARFRDRARVPLRATWFQVNQGRSDPNHLEGKDGSPFPLTTVTVAVHPLARRTPAITSRPLEPRWAKRQSRKLSCSRPGRALEGAADDDRQNRGPLRCFGELIQGVEYLDAARAGIKVMSNQDEPPTVFVSYSHDGPEHKRWVLEFAAELRQNGVDPIIDAWDLRPGDDVPKFMERGVRDSDRVLMICTEKYVAKANDGVGGVGYEAMIVTSELVRDLGTAKFIPIIRQNTDHPEVPTSVATRRYINLSEGGDRAAEMQTLLRDLHSVPPEKPPLGQSPFGEAASTPAPEASASGVTAAASRGSTAEGEEAISNPGELYQAALLIAESGDMLKWRRTVASARRSVRPALKTWQKKYATTHSGEINALIEQSMEGAAAFAPLTAIALAGVASGRSKFGNQIGLLEDILNPSEWERSGFVVRVELPETGAFAYQALLGSTCLHIENVRLAIDLARCSTVDRKTGNTMPLWRRHDIVMWPEALGKNAIQTWQVALGLSARWPWVGEIFSDESDYQAALYAYYVIVSFVEYVERVRDKFDFPEDPAKAQWWPDVPVFFEITDDEIKRRGYQLVLAEKGALRSWLSEVKVDESRLLQQWPRWIGAQARVLAQERAFWRSGLTFERLIYDLVNN